MIKSEAIKILHEVEKHQGFVIFIQCFRWKLKCTEEETCIECESISKRRQKQELDISARQTAGTVFARYKLVPKKSSTFESKLIDLCFRAGFKILKSVKY
jgi:hypothetical protein